MPAFEIDLAIAFASDPLDDTPTFTDIDNADILSITINRGRSSLLDRWSTSTCSIVLKNNSRDYDPLNTAGPHYGDLLTNKQVRIRSITSGNTRALWYGYVDAYEQGYDLGGNQTCTIRCVDGFKLLSQIHIINGSDFLEHTSAQRLTAILDSAKVSWPASLRNITTSPSTVVSADDRSYPASDHYEPRRVIADLLYELDATENGLLFMSTTGQITFASRQQLVTDAVYTTPQIDLTDDGTGISYQSINLRMSDALVKNEVIVSHALNAWEPQIADDGTSQTAYGWRSHGLTTLDVAATAGYSTASNLVRYFKDPQHEARVQIDLHRSAAIADAVTAGLGYGWRVSLTYTPLSGAPITEEFWVRQIGHQIPSGQEWAVTLDLVPVRAPESFWIWGTGEWGTAEWAW